MGGKGGNSGPSQTEMMEMQRTLQRESFEMQQDATFQQEERASARREEERKAELERRREAELEKAEKMAEEEKREGIIMSEASSGTKDEESYANLNLDSPQIEAPDYAPEEELE